ncbi:MAG: hypothetical protein RLZZ500_932 [Bacteroidota bacterium]|jgi:hypothetical protein
MKKIYAFIFVLVSSFTSAQILNFPDVNFKNKLLEADVNNMIALDINLNPFKIDSNSNGYIELNEASLVGSLYLSNANITDLEGLQYFTQLKVIYCDGNPITSFYFPSLTLLESVEIYCFAIGTITASNFYLSSDLKEVILHSVSQMNGGVEIDFSSMTQLEYLVLDYASNGSFTPAYYPSSLKYFYMLHSSNSQMDLSALVNLETVSLKFMYSLTSLQLPNTSSLKTVELENVALSQLNTGMFPNLEKLVYYSNVFTTPLDLSANTNLKEFSYSNENPNGYYISNSNLQNYPNLKNFTIESTPINGSLALHFLTQNQLEKVVIRDCGLTSVDIRYPNSVNQLYFGLTLSQNPLLTTFDSTHIPKLNYLSLYNNSISSLNLSSSSIQTFVLRGTNISTLDLRNNSIKNLTVVSYFLTELLIKDGVNVVALNLDCPNLNYICGDTGELNTIQGRVNFYGYTNCQVNSYCDLGSGGVPYVITGTIRYDSNSNGCTANDILGSSIQMKAVQGSITEMGYTTGNGMYSLEGTANSYTLTPILENPSYFTVSPTSATVNFPTAASPFTQDFCLTKVGNKNDFEVAFIPITNARPGFSATYLVVYRNKGNTTQSGWINLTYPNALAHFASATQPVVTQTATTLYWNFNALLPFETRSFYVTFTLNTPTASPPLNGGDVLSFLANVTGTSEVTPADNTATLSQIVVNSFDPNDKQCLEGTVVGTDKIGQYVHYVIRFENTGTFAAQNIVVADVINTNQLDLNSLIPLVGSHPFTTRIVNGNRVEFIFENINLPFDDATNDGFVSFKIKTKSSLVAGDTFTNSAQIYFDYNYPIITNTASTLIQNLGVQENTLTEFALETNPVKNKMIFAPHELRIESVSIYALNGQLLQITMHPNAEGVDVSRLAPGTYFVQVFTADGTQVLKMMKE